MKNDKPQLPLVQVKGSWEERIAHTARLLGQDDPAALAQSQALIDRLGRLPAQQRAAADHRLDHALMVALQNQARYHAADERYADAAATMRHGARYFSGETAKDLEIVAMSYLLCDGQTTTALDTLATLAADGDIDSWAELVAAAIRSGEFDYAHRGLEQAQRWVNQTYQAALDAPAARRDQALLANLRARYAVSQGNIAEAVAWYEHAMTLDDFFGSNPSFLYRHLVNMGAAAEAETLLRADTAAPVRSHFWFGLLEQRRGRFDHASRHWQKVTQGELPADDEAVFLEYVLSHYYLGDESGVGLAAVLEVLNTEETSWGALYLAGLGWALRGDMKAAHMDLHLACKLFRSDGGGRLLPNESWLFCRDLLDEEKCESIKEFFDHAPL